MSGSKIGVLGEAPNSTASGRQAVVIDIASRVRRNEVESPSRASHDIQLRMRALWELRRLSRMERRLQRAIAIRHRRLAIRRAACRDALRAARRRELVEWARQGSEQRELARGANAGSSLDAS